MTSMICFAHRDPDALRIEIAGRLTHDKVDAVYETWQREACRGEFRRLIVDITFITHADAYGIALLTAAHRSGAEIIASTPEAYAIARTITREAVPTADSKGGWPQRVKNLALRLHRSRIPGWLQLPKHLLKLRLLSDFIAPRMARRR
jgi:hypothetical protein